MDHPAKRGGGGGGAGKKTSRSNLSLTVFVRYSPPNPAVTRALLSERFSEYGPVKKCSVIRNQKQRGGGRAEAEEEEEEGGGSGGRGSRGYGFVRFASEEDAAEAAKGMDKAVLTLADGSKVRLRCEGAAKAADAAGRRGQDPRPPAVAKAGADSGHEDGAGRGNAAEEEELLMNKRKRTARVIVRNLAFSAGENHIRRAMEERFGGVVDVHLPSVPGSKDENGRKRGGRGTVVPRHRGFAFVTFENSVGAQKAVDEGGAVEIKGRPVAIDFSVSKMQHRRMAAEEKSGNDCNGNEGNGEEGGEEGHTGSDEASEDEDGGSGSGSSSDDDDGTTSSGAADSDSESDTEQKRAPRPENDPRRTLFVRNVPFDANRTDLFNAFRHQGRIESIYLVKDRDTGIGKGTAFVRYETEGGAKKALETAGSSVAAGSFVGGLDGEGDGIYLSGRRLLVNTAVDRDTAASLKVERDEDGKPLEKKMAKDKRNIYLAAEGKVAGGTEDEPGPWDELPETDRLKRQRAHSEKQSKLRSPLFFINPFRLSFRNLAKHVDESDLKKLAARGIQAGLEANLVTKEDVMAHWRASGDMTARDIVQKITDEEEAGTSIIPPYVESAGLKRHIPSVFIDRDFGGSGAAAEGRKSIPPSKGFGFAEFTHHAHALACLRELNNNPAYSAEYAAGGKKAVEMKKRMRKGVKKGTKSGIDLEAGGVNGGDFVGDDGKVRIPRLIVELTVENKAKANRQVEHREQQLANAKKQRTEMREKKRQKIQEDNENGGGSKRKKKGRGALQREKKRKLKGAGGVNTTPEPEEENRLKPRKISSDEEPAAKPEQAKIKKVKPPKKRKVDKDEAAFEKMVRSYKAAFSGSSSKQSTASGNGKADGGHANSTTNEDAVPKKRWFE